MSNRRERVRRWATLAMLLIAFVAPLRASDHADPIDVFMRKPLEPGITDLFVFPSPDRKDEMVVILCVRRALTDTSRLKLEPYTYKIHMDLNSAVRFDKEDELARYGGSIDHPERIAPTVTMTFRFNNDATLREKSFEGLKGTDRITVWSGVRDDPFIFPQFFGTNVAAIVLSIPMDAFPPGQKTWISWATSSKSGKQIDHVGRSLRTQQPRFELLNTLPPSEHKKAIQEEHEHPSLMRELGYKVFTLQQLFAYRAWDQVPDVMIYSNHAPVGFPNGRLLTDDVAELLSRHGDTLLKELSFVPGKGWPRVTKNDKDFLPAFPYLADPHPEREQRPRLEPLSTPTKLKLAAIIVALFLFWFGTAYLFAIWYHRRQLRQRYL